MTFITILVFSLIKRVSDDLARDLTASWQHRHRGPILPHHKDKREYSTYEPALHHTDYSSKHKTTI